MQYFVIDSECKYWAAVLEKGTMFVQPDLDVRPEMECDEDECYAADSVQDDCGGGATRGS